MGLAGKLPNQTAAIQMATAMAMTTQTNTRSRVLMRCGLGAGQGMERNCNGENHYCSHDNEKGHSAKSLPHALNHPPDTGGLL